MDSQTMLSILAGIGGIIALIQLGLLPFLYMLRSDVQALKEATTKSGDNVAEMKVSLAEMKGADQLATKVAEQALHETQSIRDSYQKLQQRFNTLLLSLAREGVLKDPIGDIH